MRNGRSLGQSVITRARLMDSARLSVGLVLGVAQAMCAYDRKPQIRLWTAGVMDPCLKIHAGKVRSENAISHDRHQLRVQLGSCISFPHYG